MRYLAATARPILEDLAGTVSFYALYLATGSAATAAAVALLIGVAQILLHVLRGRPVPTLLAIGVALTVVLGVLTLYARDATFLLLKPSIIYAIVGLTMLPRGWVRRYVPPIALDLLPGRTFARVGWAWAGLMFGTAGRNLLLVASMAPARAAAVFVLFAIASKLALFAGQYVALHGAGKRTYLTRPRSED